MGIKLKSLKNDIKYKEFKYSDDFFELKHDQIVSSNTFSWNNYKVFDNINDIKTNNFSNLFLTNKSETSLWLDYKKGKSDDQLGLITTLSFLSDNYFSETNPGAWLYFNKNYDFWDIYLKSAPYTLTKNRPEENYLKYIFYINFINDTECEISHNFGDLHFYLSVKENLTIQFSTINDETTKFIYNIKDNKLRLFKKVKTKINDEYVENLYILKAIPFTESNNTGILLDSDLTLTTDSIIFINNNIMDFSFYLNSSWISYDRRKFISSINRLKSAFGIESQMILSHEYNNDNGINFLPLKNYITYKGNYIRGNNLNISWDDYPDVNFREYTNINSGINQEFGNDNIILNYTFYDQEYNIRQGEDLFIYIPSKDENNNIEPLWPYSSININDTKFIKNGSFGSDNPIFADKFKKLQINTSFSNNGSYLCTWLFQPNLESEATWLDRYYYPDLITKEEALSKNPMFLESFNNIIDKNYLQNTSLDSEDRVIIKKVIKDNTVFDKVSDLTIEGGCNYKYSRVSNDIINEINKNLLKDSIIDVENQNKVNIKIDEPLPFDNKSFYKINHKQFNKTNKLNFNTDIYLDSNKKIGLQLFGTDYTSGFNIQNRKDLAPFHYYSTDKEIFLLNNQFEIKRTFKLFEKYNDFIVKFILGDPFDDIIIISPLFLYILTYDLKIKTKIDYNDILNIETININESDKLINYPYDLQNTKIGIVNITSSNSVKIIKPDDVKIPLKSLNINNFISVILGMNHYNNFRQIPTTIASILSQNNSLLYKSNIYIPVEQDIIKIILIPNNKNDDFSETELITYPAKARKMKNEEYFLNYIRKNDTEYEYESGINGGDIYNENTALENGFIKVDLKIKNIYFDDKDNLYAFNFDKIAISSDKDTIYGLYNKDIMQGGWYWIYNQSLSQMQSSISTSKYVEFASNDSIDFIKFNEYGDMALIRNFYSTNKNKRLEIYDKTKAKIYEYDLKAYDEIYSLDVYNFIDINYKEHTVFTILAKNFNDSIDKISYYRLENKIITDYTNLSVNKNEFFKETTNSNTILRYNDTNNLYFNLYLPSNYLYDHHAQISWDISDIQTGWYNINVSIDLNLAEFIIKINDIEYQRISYLDTNQDGTKKYPWFNPYLFASGSLFDSTYYLGCVGKKYGVTLNNIINRKFRDAYICKNAKLKNTQIHTTNLSFSNYQAMRLKNNKIHDLIITLPCGQRNNIEEIVRYFRYNTGGSVSNNIKINISGTGLNTVGEIELLKEDIYKSLENNLDILVNVKEIEFI